MASRTSPTRTRASRPSSSRSCLRLVLAALLSAPAVADGDAARPLVRPSGSPRAAVEDAPLVVQGTLVVPAGQTVVLEPGDVVQVQAQSTWVVEGTVLAQGGPGGRVSIEGLDPSASVQVRAGGLLQMQGTDVTCRIEPMHGDTFGGAPGDLVARDCSFSGAGGVEHWLVQNLPGRRSLLVLEDCTFTGVGLRHLKSQAVLRRVDFVDLPLPLSLVGYQLLDGVTVDGAGVSLGTDRGVQPASLGNLTITDVPGGPGLLLNGPRDYLVEASTTIRGALHPVELGLPASGLLPGSVVPATGNANAYVLDTAFSDPGGDSVWAALDVPYLVRTPRFVESLEILPGARVEFAAGAGWFVEGTLRALGTPDAPIVFSPRQPGSAWDSIGFGGFSLDRLDHCLVGGARLGLATVGATVAVTNSVLEDCEVGFRAGQNGNLVALEGSLVRRNLVGLEAPFSGSGTLLGNGQANPNRFEDNAVGVEAVFAPARYDLTGNWWGSPSGPTHPENPGGTGDPARIDAGSVIPFRSLSPAASVPPTVRLRRSWHEVFEPGEKVIVCWEVADGGALVEQRVRFSPDWNFPDAFVTLAELGPGARSFELEVPDVGLQLDGSYAVLRVEAVDAAGRVGWDEQRMEIPPAGLSGELAFTSNLAGPFQPGDPLALTWSFANPDPLLGSCRGWLELDGDAARVKLAGGLTAQGALGGLEFLPDVSSDYVRAMIVDMGNGNRAKWHLSEPFEIRPHALLGDEPPTVTLLTPSAGDVFRGGEEVELSWTAADDEGLRSLRVVASYDGGRFWYPVSGELPGTARSYVWELPSSTGIDDVRVRVIAKDLRFQDSSDGAQRPFTILPGAGGGPAAFRRLGR